MVKQDLILKYYSEVGKSSFYPSVIERKRLKLVKKVTNLDMTNWITNLYYVDIFLDFCKITNPEYYQNQVLLGNIYNLVTPFKTLLNITIDTSPKPSDCILYDPKFNAPGKIRAHSANQQYNRFLWSVDNLSKFNIQKEACRFKKFIIHCKQNKDLFKLLHKYNMFELIIDKFVEAGINFLLFSDCWDLGEDFKKVVKNNI